MTSGVINIAILSIIIGLLIASALSSLSSNQTQEKEKTTSPKQNISCNQSQCFSDSTNTCHENADTIQYKNNYWKCANGNWDKQCSSYKNQPYFTGEIVKKEKNLLWECSQGNWTEIGCQQGDCYDKKSDACYNSTQTIKNEDYYQTCAGGTWIKNCAYNNTYYYDGDQRLNSKDIILECQNTKWVSKGCMQNSCYSSAEKKCFFPGEIAQNNSKYYLCDNGQWEIICKYNNSYYYRGDQTLNSKNKVLECNSKGAWTNLGCKEYNCYSETLDRCVENGGIITIKDIDRKCVKGAWIKEDSECGFDECIYAGDCYDVGDEIEDDYGDEWECVDDDGDVHWEED